MAYFLLTRKRIGFLNDAKKFEHAEVRELIDFPNPPVPTKEFNPTGPSSKKELTVAQVYGVGWIEQRLQHGGGMIGDECGMGKVCI